MGIDYQRLIPYKEDKLIQELTDGFRTKYWGNEIPVDIELIVERDLRLLIIPIEGLKQTCDTDAILLGNLQEINYDPKSPANRVRYTIAHEVGHLILHREAITKLRPKSFNEWINIIQSIPEMIWGRAEYQAYEFAGRLLVPPEKLMEEIQKLNLIEKAKLELPDIEEEVLINYITPRIAKKFDVSTDVIKKRIKIEKIIL